MSTMTATHVRPSRTNGFAEGVGPGDPREFHAGRTRASPARWGLIAAAVLLGVVSLMWLRDAGRFGQRTDDLRDRAAATGAKLGLSKSRIDQARLELASLQSELADAEATLTETQSELDGLEAGLGQLDQTVRPMVDAVLAVEADLLGLSDRFDDTAGALNAITATFDTAMTEGNRRDITTMLSTFDSVRGAVADLNAGLDECTTQLADVRAQLDALSTTPPGGSQP